MSSQNQEFSRLRSGTKFEPFKDGGGTGFSGWRSWLEPPRPVPTPAVAGGRVFFGAGFGRFDFFAFDALTGAPLGAFVRTTMVRLPQCMHPFESVPSPADREALSTCEPTKSKFR